MKPPLEIDVSKPDEKRHKPPAEKARYYFIWKPEYESFAIDKIYDKIKNIGSHINISPKKTEISNFSSTLVEN